MEITREQFDTWATGHNWLLLNEVGSVQGRQQTYLTGTGEVVFAIFSLAGMLLNIAKPAPQPQSQQQTMPRLNLNDLGNNPFKS